ncbi:MAG: hypothetical protein KDA86_09970 [Planctomycetaceae bacterium]|nr:hypothetical protein [Planctomycetaceae bacterium]
MLWRRTTATLLLFWVSVNSLGSLAQADTHTVQPGDDPQAVLDRAVAGDELIFASGLHQHRLGKHRSLLYVDKPITIELKRGAVLKLADGETQLEAEPEITIDHGAPKKLNDLEVGGEFDLTTGPIIFRVQIDGEGKDGQSDTFEWSAGDVWEESRGTKVQITGDWQPLAHGVAIRFDSTTGHNRGSLWFLSYDGPEAYGIRIGHGTQPEYVENVRIVGDGTIDMNRSNNIVPSGLVKNINACVLVHGRVRGVHIEGITMTDTMRSVMLYGEHTGEFLRGGDVGPGESFDAEDITIVYTRTLNPHGAAYLLGHPSHRGHLRNVRCNFNYMVTGKTALEPNFQLDQYQVIGNIIKSDGQAIHCWRKSTNGVVQDNIRIDDNTGKPVVVVNSPGAWEDPENISLRNNRNHLSDRVTSGKAE